MNNHSSHKNFERGRIIQAASAVLGLHAALLRGEDVPGYLEKQFDDELLRLINNELQLRNNWGNPVQLAMLIILMTEGYVPCLKE